MQLVFNPISAMQCALCRGRALAALGRVGQAHEAFEQCATLVCFWGATLTKTVTKNGICLA